MVLLGGTGWLDEGDTFGLRNTNAGDMSSDTTNEEPDLEPSRHGELPPGQRIAKKPFNRLRTRPDAVDFWGRRRIWLAISGVLIVIMRRPLSTRALNLGIDFEGGVA